MEYTYPVIVHKDDEGFWAEFPDLPGCVTQAATKEELLSNCKEAAEGYLQVLLDEGDNIPTPTNIFPIPCIIDNSSAIKKHEHCNIMQKAAIKNSFCEKTLEVI